MATSFLIISAVLFIISYGVQSVIISGDNTPMYTAYFIGRTIPIISGLILPVIPLTIVTDFPWWAVFLVNLVVVKFIVPFIAIPLLERVNLERSLGYSVWLSFIGGVITLIIGLLIN